MSHTTGDWFFEVTEDLMTKEKAYELIDRFRREHMAIIRVYEGDALLQLSRLVFPNEETRPTTLLLADYHWNISRVYYTGVDDPEWSDPQEDEEVTQMAQARLHPNTTPLGPGETEYPDALTLALGDVLNAGPIDSYSSEAISDIASEVTDNLRRRGFGIVNQISLNGRGRD